MTEQEQKQLTESLVLTALKDLYFKKLKQEVGSPSQQLDVEINILQLLISDLSGSFDSPQEENSTNK